MVKGHTYSEQLFESEAFRHFVNTFLNKESGITKGCEITQTASMIEIGQGFFIIMGGLLEDTGTSMSVPTEAGYYRLVYEIDLSKINTEAEFNQGSYKFVKGVGSYANLTQEDLDNEGNVYQFEFCQFKVTEAGIADFVDKRNFLDFDNIYEEIRKKITEIEDGSAFCLKPKTLWENTNTNPNSFASQEITLNSNNYDYVIIYAYRNASGDTVRTVSAVVEKGKSGDLIYSDYLGGNTRAWMRKVSINDAKVEFEDCTINGSTNNQCLVPYKIVGCNY